MVHAAAASRPSAASKAPTSHPPFAKMIVEAISSLKERGGSSRQAILKYIKTHYNVDEKVAETNVRRLLVSATAAGNLIQVKGAGASGSFRVSHKEENKSAPRRKSSHVVPKTANTSKKAAPTKEKLAGLKAPKKMSGKSGKVSKPKKLKKPVAKRTPKKSTVGKK